ncbi:RNA ligase family protein [Peribacillus muralis]|uniref:RNA ligase family protein n=1 Tax=Peribacillus muralis TaxID=264697 RepID=UPI00366CC3E9
MSENRTFSVIYVKATYLTGVVIVELRKYPKIERLGKKMTVGCGDEVIVMEKIDGSNGSFSTEGDEIHVFSRNVKLSETDTLRGFYPYIQGRYSAADLNPDYIYYGEWVVPHKVLYKEEHLHTFKLFDVYSKSESKFLDLDIILEEGGRLDLDLAPVLYVGMIPSLEWLRPLVGISLLNGDESGEGIVIKVRGTRLKWVSEGFAEKAGISYKEPKQLGIEGIFVQTYVTEARVEKILYKLQDEGVITDDTTLKDMGWLIKDVSNRVCEDVLEEEGDELPADASYTEVKKSVAKCIGGTVRRFVNSLC